MDATEICFTPALELAKHYRTRMISPVEVADAILARIERQNPRINAYLTVTADLAREQARAAERRMQRGELTGPLDGIPFSIKDLEPTRGIRTTRGSRFYEHDVPTEDGVQAERLRATGGILLGKTNVPHFGYKDMCDNLIGPPGRNPWKTERTCGGSSGGAAAAVAAGLGPLAQGSDGAGSVRIPCALCGVFGIKPSFGLLPYHPNPYYWASRSHMGPIARTVRDGGLLLNAMAGFDARDPTSLDGPVPNFVAACDGDLNGQRVVWSADFGYAPIDPEVRAIAERAARRFAELGCAYEERDPGWANPKATHDAIWDVMFASRYFDRAVERPEWFEATLMQIILRGSRTSAVDHGKAELGRTAFYQEAHRFFQTCDLLITPQYGVAAWPVESGVDEGPRDVAGHPVLRMYDRMAYTFPFNFTGQPAATVPCGFTAEGLPVALQIVGRIREDALVMRAAAAFEALLPWQSRRPPDE